MNCIIKCCTVILGLLLNEPDLLPHNSHVHVSDDKDRLEPDVVVFFPLLVIFTIMFLISIKKSCLVGMLIQFLLRFNVNWLIFSDNILLNDESG